MNARLSVCSPRRIAQPNCEAGSCGPVVPVEQYLVASIGNFKLVLTNLTAYCAISISMEHASKCPVTATDRLLNAAPRILFMVKCASSAVYK